MIRIRPVVLPPELAALLLSEALLDARDEVRRWQYIETLLSLGHRVEPEPREAH